MELRDILSQGVMRGASDIHLTTGVSPFLRLNGLLKPLEYPPLKPEDTQRMAGEILDSEKAAALQLKGEVDLSWSCPGVGSFRINVFRQRGAVGMACRVIGTKIPTLRALGHPEIVTTLARRSRGLVLVTGPAGSGKTTTLAAMINLINEEKTCHIVTLEDPVEYIHTHKKSIVNQREVGQDSINFPGALRAALRQDPDVIMVGEMRDLETISIAVTAAETGHLVLATLHTLSAPQAVERIIDVFPPAQQQQVRVQMANTLAGIISQRLLRSRDGRGRLAAVEIMVGNTAVRALIREGKTHQLYSVMQSSARFGMQTMDSHLQTLAQNNMITAEEALENAHDYESMRRFFEQRSVKNNNSINRHIFS